MNTNLRCFVRAFCLSALLGYATQAGQAQQTFPQRQASLEEDDHLGRIVLGGSFSA